MATKAELVEMAVGAGLSTSAAEAHTKAELEEYLAQSSVAEPEEEAKPHKAKKAAIVRKSAVAWWCPFCDNSNHSALERCGKCGAEKQGDEAVL